MPWYSRAMAGKEAHGTGGSPVVETRHGLRLHLAAVLGQRYRPDPSLGVRETSFMGLALAIHLGIVYAFFLVLPFSKFVHAIYRFAALLADAGEVRRSAM